jgi:hypothetical protein
MEVKVKTLASGDFLIEVGFVLLNYPPAVLQELDKMMDYRLMQQAPEDKLALEKALENYQSIALKIASLDAGTLQDFLFDLQPIQRVVLCRMDKSGQVQNKVMANLSKIKRLELQDDLGRYEKISTSKGLIIMEKLIPIIKETIRARKQKLQDS